MALERVYSPITRDKQIPRSMFMGKPSLETSFIRLSFSLDGTVKVQNEWNDEFTVNPPTFGSTPKIELYEDVGSQLVAYCLSFTLAAKTYEVWVYFKFNVDPYKVKIAITGTLPTATQIKIPLTSVKQKLLTGKCVWFGTLNLDRGAIPNTLVSGVCFDWNDVITSASFDDVNNEAVFNVGTAFSLDPTVGTSTDTGPVRYSFQKKTFYANGRWWAWYYNGGNFGWETSTDGDDWSGSFTSYSAYPAIRHDIWYDEANNKICIVRVQGSSGNVYYRQGTANSDGTITWDSAEVLVSSDSYTYDPVVCKDSDGYPWIIYQSQPSPYYCKVVQATATDGSSWGTPTTLWTAAGRASLVPLTAGKMLAIWLTDTAATVKSKLYDGSWGSEVTASTSNAQGSAVFGVVADGDNVHLVFLKQTSYDIVYIKYVYGTGWGSEETVESSTVNQYHPSITLKDTDKVRVFYLKSQTNIKYRDRDTGSWQTAVDISTSESTMTCLSSSYKAFLNKLAVMWKSGASSPYNVKIQTYTLAGGVTHEIYVDAISNTSTTHAEECAFNIAKDAAVTSQVEKTGETTFNIPEEALVQTLSVHSEETVYNLLKDALTQVLATAFCEVGIFKEATVQVSATRTFEVLFIIPKEAIVKAFSTPSLQTSFNLSPEAVVKVLAEVNILKEGEVKVTKLFLMLGNLAIQIQGD